MKNYPNLFKFYYISFFAVIILFFSQTESSNQSIVLENFEEYSNSKSFFNTWLDREDSNEKTENIYKIVTEDNNKFLTANSTGTSVQIAKKIKWDIKSCPILIWKWRATKLPEGANEDERGKNDSGASIYVLFQRSTIPFLSWKYQPVNAIKYVWSTNLPTGKIVRKDKIKAGKIVYEGYFFVVESGVADIGKWITEERNVLEDYRKAFKEDPKKDPFLIAILTDSNDTKSVAAADYDDIIIKKISTDGK